MSRELTAGVGVAPDRLIPDLLIEHPEARTVLDRYGLKGCGGPLGPHETLRFFARAHGVDEVRLLTELDQAIAHPEPEAVTFPEAPDVADTIYRRFFLAGVAVVLTAGATWGAWLLWTIGLGGSTRAVSVHAVNAHGEAQIFGWVGLFIMGFAYQAFPRMWHSRLVAPWLAVVAFGLMVSGLIVRTIGIAAAGGWDGAAELALAGGLMEVAAVCLFAGQIFVTHRKSGAEIEPYVGFAAVAIGWFVLSSAFSVWHSWRTMTAPDRDSLLWAVSTYQAPLRDMQIHGLALTMILGVSIRMFPGIFNLPVVPARRAWWALGLLTASVAAETLIFLAFRWTGEVAFAAALEPIWVVMTAAALLVVLPWKLWRPLPESDRTGKFIRAAYGWLFVSLTMLLLLPAYYLVGNGEFSHAYFGAARHAITVGFVSMMIMGMAAKVAPTLNGVDSAVLSNLRGPFILVNLGCLLRVATQIATDWTDSAYAVIGLSGTMEVAGLAWWGFDLFAAIRRGLATGRDPARTTSPPPKRIEAVHKIADVLAWFPTTESVFYRHGFTALKSAALRRTLARQTSVAQAAAMRRVDLETLLDDLNASALKPIQIALPTAAAPEDLTCAKGGAL